MKRLGVALLLVSSGAISRAADLSAALRNVHLASRLGTDRILIQGGVISGDFNYSALPIVPGEPDWIYGTTLRKVTSEWLANISTDRPTNWRRGDKWKLYTGAGAPIDIRIDDIVVASRYLSAVARFSDPEMADRVGGLTATHYLAAPSPGLPAVSGQPMVPFVGEMEQLETKLKVEKAALNQARQLVASKEWKARKEVNDEASRLDRVLFETQSLNYDLHLARWSLSGHKPLLFAQIVWRERSREPVFGANVILEEGEALSILDFDSRPGEEMRVGENEQADTWNTYEPVFLNAWAIGNRRFVLKFTRYYESVSADLMELIPSKGLKSTGLYSYAGP